MRVYLGITGALWALYGLYCFVRVGDLAELAGVTATNSTGVTELRAMYGGLQAGAGIFFLAAAWRPAWQVGALRALVFVYLGLGTARLLAALGGGGFSSYTIGGIAFEFGAGLLTLWLLRK